MRSAQLFFCSLALSLAACGDDSESTDVREAPPDAGESLGADSSTTTSPGDVDVSTDSGASSVDAATPSGGKDGSAPASSADAATGVTDAATGVADAGKDASAPVDSGDPPVAEAGMPPLDGGPDLGGIDAGEKTRTLAVRVRGLDLAPIAGASICLFPAGAPCSTSGVDGASRLGGLPTGENLLLEISTAAHLPGLRMVQAGGADLDLNTQFLTEQGTAALALLSVGRSLNPARGHLVITAFDGASRSVGLAGVTILVRQLSEEGMPTNSTGGALGVYTSDDLRPDPLLVETGRSGTFFALDVAPGNYVVTFDHDTRPCDEPLPVSSWGSNADGSAPAPIFAGHQTSLAVQCN